MSKAATASAWALLVVSDPGQADTLVDQEAWAAEVAVQRGWSITKTLSGVSSGKLGVRRLTMQMISELEALAPPDRPQRLLMIRLERLGRGDGVEAMEAFIRLRRLGVVVHTRLDGDVSYDRASDLLMPVLRLFIGGMENEVRRDKLLSMYQRRRDAHSDDPTVAVSMRPPYGLTYKSGHLEPKPDEAAAVRLAYDMKTQGYGHHVIAKRLAQVAPPMALKNGAQWPQRWTADRIARLIKNETYKDVLIDAALWERAQQPVREIQRPTRRFEYSLGGALRCVCGYALTGVKGTGKKSSTFRYYRCSNYEAHGSMKHHRSNLLEEQFIALLARLEASDDLLRTYLAGQDNNVDEKVIENRLIGLKSELAGIDKRKRAIFSLFEDGVLPKEDLQWRLADLQTTEENLTQQLEALTREQRLQTVRAVQLEDLRAIVQDAHQHWLTAPIDDRRALARAIANAFGGLTVDLDSTLLIGVRPDEEVKPSVKHRHLTKTEIA